MTTVKSGVPCRHEQHPGCACVAGRPSHGICQVLDCRVRRGMDEPCQCKECLLDTLVHLCRSFHERVDAQIIGELARLLLCNRPLVRPV